MLKIETCVQLKLYFKNSVVESHSNILKWGIFWEIMYVHKCLTTLQRRIVMSHWMIIKIVLEIHLNVSH